MTTRPEKRHGAAMSLFCPGLDPGPRRSWQNQTSVLFQVFVTCFSTCF